MQSTDVRDTALGAVDQSKSFLNRQVDERTTQLGDQIGTVASDLRSVAGDLRGSPAIGIAGDYIDRGADLVENAARYLREADGERLLNDLESIARRQPWACAAGALMVGFAASRFLKTSSTRRYYASTEAQAESYPQTGAYSNG